LVDSLRTFGGDLAEAPVWIFMENPDQQEGSDHGLTRQFRLKVPPDVGAYPFGRTVAACAQAEEMASSQTNSLVWIDPSCLIIQPPELFELGSAFDAAFRPVHIRNIGLSPNDELDDFWRSIYHSLGLGHLPFTVTSFVDNQCLRPYFNSHAFSINPALGIMRLWHGNFQQLISDHSFQSAACQDDLHKIFLFQAILSTLVASRIDPARLRILPSSYNYPYNLQARVPDERRARTLNELVCLTYEERDLRPDMVSDIQILEPLSSWLTEHVQ
ncbi:MAG TPA: hypothetical protein VLM80_01665, partial [Anaerolineales bacterium]|nr:hypothetical protein [Anaerolineales bacterium]